MDNKHLLKTKVFSRISSIELVNSEKCQNACTYCYRTYKHNKSNLYAINGKRANDLLRKFLDLFELDNSFYTTKSIEMFGGDGLLDYKLSMEVLQVLNYYKPKLISIPTNARLISELTEYDIITLLSASKDTPISLSLSVDGTLGLKYRKLSKIGQMLGYEEKINYDKLFKLSKKYKWGYHPMLPFEESDRWLEVVKFFYNDYGIVPYLLEIRHPLSKENIIKSVRNLVRIRNFYEEKLANYDKESKDKILSNANTIHASQCPRGIGCSALTTMYIMPNGDLPFCHRVIDPPWVMANIDQKTFDISKLVNFRSGYDHRNHPLCMVCPIRKTCSGLCQGACYEYWGDPFIPIDSICNYILLKNWVFSRLYTDWKLMLQYSIDENLLEKKVYELFDKDIIDSIMEESNEYIIYEP